MAKNIPRPQHKVVHPPRPCVVCGTVYIPQRVRPGGGKTCSRRCISRLKNRQRAGLSIEDNKPKPCDWCAEIFMPTRADQNFCSQSCWGKRRHQRQSATRAPRKCRACGEVIESRGPQAQYCSGCIEPRKMQLNTARKKRYTKCKGCGSRFTKPQTSSFCSRGCMGTYGQRKQAAEIPKTCVACGEPFLAFREQQQTCSRSCQQWHRLRPGVRRLRIAECYTCQQPFETHRGNQRFCSNACTKAISEAKRRAALYGNYVEPVSKIHVARRDKWTCQLCGKKVNSRLKGPHPMSPSIDHVIPVSLGGEHSHANTQLAHLICNIRKGDRMTQPVQLSLVG